MIDQTEKSIYNIRMKPKFKPRNKELNDLLLSKRGGRHEEKEGKFVKRSKVKKELRKLIEEVI